MKKIAFLFLTIDNINFPKIWENYFKGHDNKFTIYCHPKYPEKVTVDWLKSNIISNLVNTGWGYIVDAYYQLLNTAYKNEDNYKFITISESCLPLVSFDILYNKLFKDDIKCSYIKFMDISNYDYKERIKKNEGYNKFKFVKHYARFCLSRFHVNKLLGETEGFEFFKKMHVGDEFFLSLIPNCKNDKFIINYVITYDNWNYVTKKRQKYNNKIKSLYEKIEKIKDNTKIKKLKDEIEQLQIIRDDFSRNPKSYTKVVNNDINDVKHINSFFWRKFPKESNIEEFYYGDKCCVKIV
jgi:hypothetical protein